MTYIRSLTKEKSANVASATCRASQEAIVGLSMRFASPPDATGLRFVSQDAGTKRTELYRERRLRAR